MNDPTFWQNPRNRGKSHRSPRKVGQVYYCSANVQANTPSTFADYDGSTALAVPLRAAVDILSRRTTLHILYTSITHRQTGRRKFPKGQQSLPNLPSLNLLQPVSMCATVQVVAFFLGGGLFVFPEKSVNRITKVQLSLKLVECSHKHIKYC